MGYPKKETGPYLCNYAAPHYHTQRFSFCNILFWLIYYLKVSSEVFLNNTFCCKSLCATESFLPPPSYEVVFALNDYLNKDTSGKNVAAK